MTAPTENLTAKPQDEHGRPRLLIEEWLPAAAIGVECMRERATGQQPPHARLHIWWARRPLTISRAAVLGSLLPADFPRATFERLLGFGRPGDELVQVRQMMDTGIRVEGGFNADRAFKGVLREPDLFNAHSTMRSLWGDDVAVIDPMAGGGSIPLEAARIGVRSLANEYNPVACTVLEATTDYPIRFGASLGAKVREWGRVWGERVEERLARFYPAYPFAKVHAYIYARTVPCPDTGHQTPLVPDWHLLKPAGGRPLVAEPVVDSAAGTWSARIREVGSGAGQLPEPPRPTYRGGTGISLFSGQQIPSDWIKAKAQAGEMQSALYAVAIKTPSGLEFRPPSAEDLAGLRSAEAELARLRPAWEAGNIIPTELYPEVSSDERPRTYGMPRWADLFSPRQLLALGVLIEELRALQPEIVRAEDADIGGAVIHLLAFVIDKFSNHNSILSSWDTSTSGIRSVFDRHDFAFKATPAEMAPCGSGSGLDWAVDNVVQAFEGLAKLPRHPSACAVEITQGSATSLYHLDDGSVTAVVVDPPYADNVQYSELADFFYVWLKRTQGHRRPEWFSTYLSEHDQEAVVNVSRHRESAGGTAAAAKREAHIFYQGLMTDVFREAKRILRDDGVLTVMFTHKAQEAWAALFESLIAAGFQVTATWPIKTESEHSLNQARKNAAQSTVILVARKRKAGTGVGYFDSRMEAEITRVARETAARLEREGLNPVDQLVGAFGPAMAVYSAYDAVREDTGAPIGVDAAIKTAADAVSAWRVEQVAARGLDGVEAEGRFALLCWDVLGAAEFRFNEAKLLGNAVGMDVARLVEAGLVRKTGENIAMLPATDRRRSAPLPSDAAAPQLPGIEGAPARGRRRAGSPLQVHPQDPAFRTALDGCHGLALAWIEAGGGSGGIGAAKAVASRQGWTRDSGVARLMEALVASAPVAMRHEGTPMASRFSEFRAWHALLQPLFEIVPDDWTPALPLQPSLGLLDAEPQTTLDLADSDNDEVGDDEDEA